MLTKKFLHLSLITILILITILLRLGGIATDWHQGIPDWHPDSARYFAQEKLYIEGSHRPFASGPLYTGNPYGNILLMSWIWHGVNTTAGLIGYNTPIGKDPFTLSKIGRGFYIFLSVLLVIILFFFSDFLFHSLFAATLSAFFFSVSPLAIGLTHTIKPELPLTFFITLSAIFIILLTIKRKLLFYILAGIFAGIATAMKYNGAMVLLFLFSVHTYKILKESQDRSLGRKIIYILLSPSLWLSILLWAFFFYAFEPVLWHNWKEGLHNIRGYLHVAAFVGLPSHLVGHPFDILVYNLKCMPANLWMLIKCTPPFFFLLAFLALVYPSKHKVKVFSLAAFPGLLLAILFTTKSLFGEEYLLHPLPFIYLLAAIGCIQLLNIFKRKHLKIAASFVVGFVIITYGFYIGFREARYASLGNIRYYANEWAAKNLQDRCIKHMLYTLLPNYKFCSRHASIFVVPSPKTYKKKYRLPKECILLKTFQLEKDKPFLHHLRGHKIRFFAYKGKNFPGLPQVPAVPVPHLHEKNHSITRFLNGIDFDPGFYTFSLAPHQFYDFRLISPHRLNTVKVVLKNSNVINKITVFTHTYKLLPFEKKLINIPLSRKFPWLPPYIYNFTVRSEADLLLRIKRPGSSTVSWRKRVENSVSDHFKKHKTDFWPIEPGQTNFKEVYKSIFQYDFKFMSNLLSKTLPLNSLKKIDKSTDFYHKNHPSDYALFYKTPVFLERGFYTCTIEAHMCVGKNGRITLRVMSPSRTLRKITFFPQSFEKIRPFKICGGFYRFMLPFEIDTMDLVHVLIEIEGKAKIKVDAISFSSDITNDLKKEMETAVARYLLSHRDTTSPALFWKLDPKLIEFSLGVKVADYLFKRCLYEQSLKWFRTMYLKNPLSKRCVGQVIRLATLRGDFITAACFRTRSTSLQSLKYGPWRLETGVSLEAYSIPRKASTARPIPFRLFMKLPGISGDQALTLILKKGNITFGKTFSVYKAGKVGNLFFVAGTIKIPEGVPPGKYEIYFIFSIPRSQYFYRVMDKKGLSRAHEIKIGQIRIDENRPS